MKKVIEFVLVLLLVLLWFFGLFISYMFSDQALIIYTVTTTALYCVYLCNNWNKPIL